MARPWPPNNLGDSSQKLPLRKDECHLNNETPSNKLVGSNWQQDEHFPRRDEAVVYEHPERQRDPLVVDVPPDAAYGESSLDAGV